MGPVETLKKQGGDSPCFLNSLFRTNPLYIITNTLTDRDPHEKSIIITILAAPGCHCLLLQNGEEQEWKGSVDRLQTGNGSGNQARKRWPARMKGSAIIGVPG